MFILYYKGVQATRCGVARQLESGKWAWSTTFGRSCKKQFDSADECKAACLKSLGNRYYFAEAPV